MRVSLLSYCKSSMDDPLIAPWERLAASRAEMASAEGISVRTLQRRLKRQREIVAEQYQFNPDKLEVVPLVHGDTDDEYRYRMDTDQLSVLPSGLFWVGDRHGRRLKIQHAGNGRPVEKPAEAGKRAKSYAAAHTRQRKAKPMTPEELEAIKAKFKPKGA